MSRTLCSAPKDYKCTPYNHKTCANCRYVIYESTLKTLKDALEQITALEQKE